MKYSLINIHDKEFEKLVVGICQIILGITVQSFSSGRDGGRDARYEGYAEKLKKDGKFIVQAKHTTNPIGKFTDNNFSVNKNSVMMEELPKIKKLIDQKELDYYLLFSNRRMSGDGETKVRQLIIESTGLPSSSIFLFGLESIENFLDQYDQLPQQYNIDFYNTPLHITPDDLADVISAFHENRLSDIVSEENLTDFYMPGIETKNQINGLSEDYFQFIQEKSYSYFKEIQDFLGSPLNEKYRKYYDLTIIDLQGSILTHKKEGDTFDLVLEKMYEHLIQRDGDLKQHRRLTRTFLHYMYCNCDIGKKDA